ncbi:MAG: BTAD domain-containing putative transcriptional regulator, partial [Chloroflexota bacterium]|nr:BTAD domain-containing putative transcriptional regulator [Chloroflexota bacterium]
MTGRTQSRDTLATLLWPENDQSSARANLRRDLVYLKKAIGEPYLETDGEQVGINLDSVTALDVAQFKSLLAKTQKHGHSQHPEIDTLCYECQDALEQAVAIYQADFMHGFSLPDCRVFDEWQFFESEDLRQKLSEALQNLIRFTGQAQEFGQAISYCRRWLALDLLHEPAHRQLMLLYALDGQQAAALRQYQECDRILEEELGLGPEPETSELFQAIRNRDVGPAISSVNLVTIDTLIGRHAPAKAQPAKRNDNLPQPSTPFVGREMELRATLNKITDPDCRILTLLGPGGSGKTRLAIQIGFDLVKDSENPFVDGVWFVQLAPLT